MFRVGDRVKWRNPLDADYSYGTIVEISGSYAKVEGTAYYTGIIMDVHLGCMERGGKRCGNSKKHSK